MANDSINLNSSGSYSCKIMNKINVPRRRDFRNIKDILPKNRFGENSVGKIIENKSCYTEKNKENVFNFVNSSKVTRKDQLPNIKRSESLNGKQEQKIKATERILCEDRPPLPKKPMRA